MDVSLVFARGGLALVLEGLTAGGVPRPTWVLVLLVLAGELLQLTELWQKPAATVPSTHQPRHGDPAPFVQAQVEILAFTR